MYYLSGLSLSKVMPVKHTAYRSTRSPSNQEIKPESKVETERERERVCVCVCVALVLGWKPEGRKVSSQLSVLCCPSFYPMRKLINYLLQLEGTEKELFGTLLD